MSPSLLTKLLTEGERRSRRRHHSDQHDEFRTFPASPVNTLVYQSETDLMSVAAGNPDRTRAPPVAPWR